MVDSILNITVERQLGPVDVRRDRRRVATLIFGKTVEELPQTHGYDIR